jgi:hypothetical protein
MTTIKTIVTPKDYTAGLFAAIVTGILFRQEETAKQFFTGPVGPAPVTEAGIRAEAQFNDAKDDMYHSSLFAGTIKALTGDAVRSFNPTGHIDWKVGMVVTPVKPAHRERSDDGYTIGQPYLVTNETTGRARGADNTTAEYLNSKNGYGVKPMSTYNDEWAQVTDQAAIEALVTLLIAQLGIKFTDAMLSDDGKSLADILVRFDE